MAKDSSELEPILEIARALAKTHEPKDLSEKPPREAVFEILDSEGTPVEILANLMVAFPNASTDYLYWTMEEHAVLAEAEAEADDEA